MESNLERKPVASVVDVLMLHLQHSMPTPLYWQSLASYRNNTRFGDATTSTTSHTHCSKSKCDFSLRRPISHDKAVGKAARAS